MNRFRRKSKSRERTTDGKGNGKARSPSSSGSTPPHLELSGAGMARSSSGASLPEPADFRTSLILPQMMKRFSLLRGADGQLVDMETMQNHLAQQRQTGRLTAYEVDAVLAQYRLQSQFESSSASSSASSIPAVPKRKRIDWSKVPAGMLPEDISEADSLWAASPVGEDSTRASFATATSSGEYSGSHSQHDHSTSVSMGQISRQSQRSFRSATSPERELLSPVCATIQAFPSSSSSSPFAASPAASAVSLSLSPSTSPSLSQSQTSTSGASGATYPYQYRRGGNSMFGGRAHAAREMKMLRSGSERSVVSLGAADEEGDAVEGEQPEEPGQEKAEEKPPEKGDGASADAAEAEREAEAQEAASPPSSSSFLTPSASVSTALAITPSASTPAGLSSLAPPDLTPKQIRRISVALDNLAAELRGSGGEAPQAWPEDEEEEEEEEGEEEHEDERRIERGEDVEEVARREDSSATEEAQDDEPSEASPVPPVAPPVPLAQPEQPQQPLSLSTALPLTPTSLLAGPGDSSAPSLSPISPVTDSDLRGLATFDIPSPTLLSQRGSDYTFGLDRSRTDETQREEEDEGMSDTEAMDPFYARLPAPAAAQVPLPPSLPASRDASPQISTTSPDLAASPSLTPSASVSSHLDTRASAPSPAPSTSSALPPPAIYIPPRAPRLHELSVETDADAASPVETSAGDTPAAFSFPFVPSRPENGVPALSGTEEQERSQLELEEPAVVEREAPLSDLAPEQEEDGEGAEAETTMATDEGPFDLSLGGIRLPVFSPVEGDAEESFSFDGAAGVPLPLSRSTSAHSALDLPSADAEEERDETRSEGSSFHESPELEGEEWQRSDDERDLPPATLEDDEAQDLDLDDLPSSARTATFPHIPSPAARPHSLPPPAGEQGEAEEGEDRLRPMSLPLDRRPSNELLAVLAAAAREERAGRGGAEAEETLSPAVPSDGEGAADDPSLVLSDLVAIQDSLVRAAARRAARLASTDTATSSEGVESLSGAEAVTTPSSFASSSSMLEPFSLTGLAAAARTPHPDLYEQSPGKDGSVEGGAGMPPVPLMPQQEQLAGLGLTSVDPFAMGAEAEPLPEVVVEQEQEQDKRLSASDSRRLSSQRDSHRSSRRASRGLKRSGAEQEDTPVGGLASVAMTMQQSQSSSMTSPTNGTGAPVTPSTNQSDAFEFSSLVGSPETQSWEDAREELREESVPSGSPFFNYQPSPIPSQLADEAEDERESEAEAEGFSAQPAEQPLQEEGEQSPEQPSTAVVSPSLGAPAPIDTESFLRVPRNMPRRDPTMSMVVRDVRNQATLATIALKKQNGPTSPQTRPLAKGKTIRKGSISSPQLVSGPIAIPAVPIIKPGGQLSESSRSSSSSSKVSRSKSSRKDKEAEGSGEKKGGLGLRFKALLKKPTSRDQLGHLNGDEITPFVETAPADEPKRSSIPLTPPNQDAARFSSPTPDFPQTPDDSTPKQSRSSAYPQPSLGLPPLDEAAERPAPTPSIVSVSPSVGSPASPGGSTNSRSLSRIMSRLRSNGRRESDASGFTTQGAMSPERAVSPQFEQSPRGRPHSPPNLHDYLDRRPSLEQEIVGLGLDPQEEPSRRAPATYQVGSPRTRRRLENDFFDAPTSPLSINKHDTSASTFSFPPSASENGSTSPHRSNGRGTRASIDSMRKLWKAAEDLGLPPDKVQELVDSAYAQSPTTSSHAHTGSTSSTVGRRSSSDLRRRPSESVARPPSPSPPVARHRTQPSVASASSRYTTDIRPSQDANRLSVYSAAPSPNLSVPHSPSLGSVEGGSGSEYANSFIDFYAGGDDDPGESPYQDLPRPPSFIGSNVNGRRPSLVPSIDEQLAMQQQRQHDADLDLQNTVRLDAIGEYGEEPTMRLRSQLNASTATSDRAPDDEVVWQVLDDLRNNRLSTISKDDSFGFHSRTSSLDVDREEEPDQSSNVANLLRHRDRKRQSVALAPWQQGRYPSIYAADESRLLALGEQGGVAPEQAGHFFVRPKEPAPEVPQLPEEYRGQWSPPSARWSSEAAMAPQFPPEILLVILELAIPPPTTLGLQKRHEDILTLAIVHRTWTPVALRHLPLPKPFDIKEGEEGKAELQLRLEQEKDTSANFLQINFEGSTWPSQRLEHLTMLSAEYSQAEHIAVSGTFNEQELSAAFPALLKLAYIPIDPYSWHHPGLSQLSATITHLSLHRVRLCLETYTPVTRVSDPLPIFPHLRTLLLQCSDVEPDWSLRAAPKRTFLTFFPALETLGWSEMDPPSPAPFIVRASPPLLRHLYLKGALHDLISIARSCPSPLKTLTVAKPSDALAGLKGWCDEEGVKLEPRWTSALRDLDQAQSPDSNSAVMKQLPAELWQRIVQMLLADAPDDLARSRLCRVLMKVSRSFHRLVLPEMVRRVGTSSATGYLTHLGKCLDLVGLRDAVRELDVGLAPETYAELLREIRAFSSVKKLSLAYWSEEPTSAALHVEVEQEMVDKLKTLDHLSLTHLNLSLPADTTSLPALSSLHLSNAIISLHATDTASTGLPAAQTPSLQHLTMDYRIALSKNEHLESAQEWQFDTIEALLEDGPQPPPVVVVILTPWLHSSDTQQQRWATLAQKAVRLKMPVLWEVQGEEETIPAGVTDIFFSMIGVGVAFSLRRRMAALAGSTFASGARRAWMTPGVHAFVARLWQPASAYPEIKDVRDWTIGGMPGEFREWAEKQLVAEQEG
ncbi:hypothetical protein JCM10213_000048 [Rhodosporidiobolus nylandii]